MLQPYTAYKYIIIFYKFILQDFILIICPIFDINVRHVIILIEMPIKHFYISHFYQYIQLG